VQFKADYDEKISQSAQSRMHCIMKKVKLRRDGNRTIKLPAGAVLGPDGKVRFKPRKGRLSLVDMELRR